jgi:hypothetical protein
MRGQEGICFRPELECERRGRLDEWGKVEVEIERAIIL